VIDAVRYRELRAAPPLLSCWWCRCANRVPRCSTHDDRFRPPWSFAALAIAQGEAEAIVYRRVRVR
jgi:hypothetical protein